MCRVRKHIGQVADAMIAVEQMRFDAEAAELDLMITAAAGSGDAPALRHEFVRKERRAVAQSEAEQVWLHRCALWRTCNLLAPAGWFAPALKHNQALASDVSFGHPGAFLVQ